MCCIPSQCTLFWSYIPATSQAQVAQPRSQANKSLSGAVCEDGSAMQGLTTGRLFLQSVVVTMRDRVFGCTFIVYSCRQGIPISIGLCYLWSGPCRSRSVTPKISEVCIYHVRVAGIGIQECSMMSSQTAHRGPLLVHY